MDYLSPEWIRAANTAVADLKPLEQLLVVGYKTEDGPTSSYSIQFGPDKVAVRPGTDGCHVTFVTSGALAAEIARGERSAQRAFLDGLVQVEGDVNVLLGYGRELASVQDCLADLRGLTTFPEPDSA